LLVLMFLLRKFENGERLKRDEDDEGGLESMEKTLYRKHDIFLNPCAVKEERDLICKNDIR
jgi:hypothetical protein